MCSDRFYNSINKILFVPKERFVLVPNIVNVRSYSNGPRTGLIDTYQSASILIKSSQFISRLNRTNFQALIASFTFTLIYHRIEEAFLVRLHCNRIFLDKSRSKRCSRSKALFVRRELGLVYYCSLAFTSCAFEYLFIKSV